MIPLSQSWKTKTYPFENLPSLIPGGIRWQTTFLTSGMDLIEIWEEIKFIFLFLSYYIKRAYLHGRRWKLLVILQFIYVFEGFLEAELQDDTLWVWFDQIWIFPLYKIYLWWCSSGNSDGNDNNGIKSLNYFMLLKVICRCNRFFYLYFKIPYVGVILIGHFMTFWGSGLDNFNEEYWSKSSIQYVEEQGDILQRRNVQTLPQSDSNQSMTYWIGVRVRVDH